MVKMSAVEQLTVHAYTRTFMRSIRCPSYLLP